MVHVKVTSAQRFIKRFFDLLAALAGVILLLPLFLLLCVIVKVSSQGPVFFSQIRIGRFGKPFRVFKFRTMYIDSEKYGSITSSSDTRITPGGALLRRFKLDELPQLWNVLIGKMSFVGPRPDVPGYADKLTGEDRKILDLRPGITGPASLYFRNEEELLAGVADPKKYNDEVIWPEKVRMNREYLEQWSIVSDIAYIMITVVPLLNSLLHLVEGNKSELK